mmetsp:Transcript_106330/g.297657  ORF Transcript_106330/g.297657 Transcript_106330/m.297657 type:complete len:240 (-) Transcript_106330:189-908(-)
MSAARKLSRSCDDQHLVQGLGRQPPSLPLGSLHRPRGGLSAGGVLLEGAQAALHGGPGRRRRGRRGACDVHTRLGLLVAELLVLGAIGAMLLPRPPPHPTAVGPEVGGGIPSLRLLSAALARLGLGQCHSCQLRLEQVVPLLQHHALVLPVLSLLHLLSVRRLRLLELPLELRTEAQPSSTLLPLALQLSMKPIRLLPGELHFSIGSLSRLLDGLPHLPVELRADAPQPFSEGASTTDV